MKASYLASAVVFLLLSGPIASAPATATQSPSSSLTTASGATFTPPPGWTEQTKGNVRSYIPPEGKGRLTLVDGLSAPNPATAIAAAWNAAAPGFKRPVKVMTERPGREGWDGRFVADYETSPNEKMAVQAIAYRAGTQWSVILLDAPEAIVDKRYAAIAQLASSLRAPGYTRESFAGKKAHKLNAARVGELKQFLTTGMEQLGVPGVAYALIQDGRIFDIGGLGVKKIGGNEPVDADTQFMIASNTKGMSTLMLATLVDEGKLKWDQPVTEVFRDFRLGDDATTKQVRIRHLVCACTGLPRKDMEWFVNTPLGTDPANVFNLLRATQPTSGFGEVFQYNNLITTAGGFIGGHVAYPGLRVADAYDRAMQERVFGPLGMTNTHFSFDRAVKGNVASPHGLDINGNPALASHDLSYSIIPYRPAGGAWSTVRDMARYAALELAKGTLPDGKRLVSETNLLERRKHGVSEGEDTWYGMGLSENRSYGIPVIYHGGSMPGYMTNFWVIPDAGVAAVLLTNSETGNRLLRPFMRRLLEVLYDGKPEAAGNVAASAAAMRASLAAERKKLTIPPSPEVVAALASTYASPELGKLRVTKADGTVTFRLANWSSRMATRKNDDGTLSFVTIDPAIDGFDFVVGTKDGKKSLIVRDSQHEYAFLEVPS